MPSPLPTGDPPPAIMVEHAACTWEQVGYRVWCREHRKAIYVGKLPRNRQPVPCPEHPWSEWIGGIYRWCPVCFLVEWRPKFAPRESVNGRARRRGVIPDAR
jgi:hypothetical protein